MHDKMREIESYQRKKSTWDQILSGEVIWSEREVFGKVRSQKGSREIEEKFRTDPIYRNHSFSMDREVLRIKTREITIKQLSWGFHSK